MARINRFDPEIHSDGEDDVWIVMEEHKEGDYVSYYDHLAIVIELEKQIKALTIKQAPY